MVNSTEIKKVTTVNRGLKNDADAVRLEEILDEHINNASLGGRDTIIYTAAGIEPVVVSQVANKYVEAGFNVDYDEFGVSLTIRW